MKTVYRSFLSLILISIMSGSITAQELSVSTTIVNRYIWRGADFGNSPSIQPTVALGAGGFTVGFWGAYPTNIDTHSEEVDLYASYGINLNGSGTVSLGFTDYMFPTSTNFQVTNFNDWDDTSPDGPGSHDLELNVGYSGPESFPISLSFNMFFYGVENNPIYYQVGYTTAVNDVGLNLFIGGTGGDGGVFYGTPESFDIVYTGITASKEIKITDSFSVPVFGSIIVNPATEALFYVFGFSL